MRKLRFAHSLLVVFLFGWAAACLQGQGTSGSLMGTVVDTTGAAIPGAVVTVQNPVSGYVQNVTTDGAGAYRIGNLPFNKYHVTATSPGFQSGVQDAQVRSAAAAALDFKLAVGGTDTVVNVEAEPEDMVSGDPTAGSSIDRILFERLPTESAAAPLSSLVTLSTPGISADSNGLFHPMGEHADTTYSVDGQPVSDQQSRIFGNQLSVNAIQSINVINGIAPPEYGDKASLVVQTTTRSGLGLNRPTGTVSYSYGNFGTSVGSVAVGVGGAHVGNFIALDGVNSGRYLDTPEFRPLHAHGNNENLFDRIDFKKSDANQFQLNLSASRSWFQNPNQYDQQAAGQDQRAKILSYNVSPSWTHVLSSQSLISVNPYLRQDNFHFYPSRNALRDAPVTLGQSRRLQNAGIKTDFSYAHGINTFKAGAMLYHTFLNEGFSFGITDPTFNAPCLLADGRPDPGVAVSDPARCPAGETGNPGFVSGSAPFDLSRGGALFRFNGRTDIKQEALYLQDNVAYKSFNFLVGVRADNYNGLSRRALVQPRLGATYQFKPTNTVLRVGYGRLFLTPYNENLITSQSSGLGGATGAFKAQALRPATRTQYDAGFEEGFGKHLVINGEYFWKYTDRDYDFDVLLNTPLAFPIQWKKSKIDGFGIKATVPEIHGVSGYAVLGHTRARFFGPEQGGILFNDPAITQTPVFRIDHDQNFEQTTHLQYQPSPKGPWYGITWRYESGEVAGKAPFATDATTPVDLTYLSGDQQAQIQIACGGVRGTMASPLSSCAPAALSSSLVKIPAPGTQNPDRNPARIAPRTSFDMAAGWDNILRGDKLKTNVSITAVNVTNKYALYNFLSTFSGTHFVPPRSVSAQVTFNF